MLSFGRWFSLLCWGCLVAPQTGCVTLEALLGRGKSQSLDTRLLEAQGYSIPPGGMPAPVSLDASRGPRIVLEVRDGDTHVETIPLPMDQAVFIEDIVQQAQLHERIGELDISIMRPSGSGPPVRLQTATNSKGKAVEMGNNYALLPGDHIVVNSDNRTGLERLIDKHFKRD